ncbi:phage tail tube protein [Ruixingdingia sedimenti]|uniref:Phage tail tube protein n=1 Tax=Ruixingdingia sedimenti TaxID=3073604 RepID=A0ABU1FFS8_9RHOB|nr:phage tail tube protein [Xinfangfangia sp. LG-4]MDR5655408.1 phage tail tube protein [Xinfangfangia sp. LG-4]
MAFRRAKRLAILHKAESSYGTDATPAAADALIGSNVTFTPIEGEEVRRDLLLPYLGHQGTILTAEYGRIEFDIEIAGSGTAGTAPKYGSILKAAGMAATVTAGVDVEYTIVEDATESGSLYFVADKVRHVFLGGQANIALNFSARQIPKIRVTYMGLLGAVTDVGSMPAVSQTGWTAPVVVSKANTVLTLHGWTAVAESLALDLGNELVARHLIGDERILISDRQSTGTAVVEARDIATIDWFAKARSGATGGLSLVHGTTAGNIVEIAAPKVQIGKPTQGETNGIINYSLPLMLRPDAGRDELVITVR